MLTTLQVYEVAPLYRAVHRATLKENTLSLEKLYEADISDLYYSS